MYENDFNKDAQNCVRWKAAVEALYSERRALSQVNDDSNHCELFRGKIGAVAFINDMIHQATQTFQLLATTKLGCNQKLIVI